jgi:hypothetical protein
MAQAPHPPETKLVVGYSEHATRLRSIERSRGGGERIRNNVQPGTMDSRGKLTSHFFRHGNHAVESFQRAELKLFIQPEFPVPAGKPMERRHGGQARTATECPDQQISTVSVCVHDVR